MRASPPASSGWVHRRRDHGQLIFLDLRDRHGLTQVVIDKADSPEAHADAERVRPEFVVSAVGNVAPRLPGTENPKLPTGAIELQATGIEILSEAKTPPFYINEPDAPVDEGVRLKYRYLDIRRQPMADRLLLRSRMVQAIREVHHDNGFVEVETPTLIKSTPEGARDFIVPSRLQPGNVYALPQSPQQLKQLLMVAGIDRYFQIARCYRDEDLRGDRQPEFTQLDLEMSFVDEATVMAFVESMVIEVSKATAPDRPDRAGAVPGLHLRRRRWSASAPTSRTCASGWSWSTSRRPWSTPTGRPRRGSASSTTRSRAAAGSAASSRRGMGGVTRREIDELTERAKRFGARGLAYLALGADGEMKGPIAKFLSDDTKRALIERSGAGEGDLLLIVADRDAVTADVLGRLRVELGDQLGLADPDGAVVRVDPPLPDVRVGRRERALARHAQPVQRRGPRGRGAARDHDRRPGPSEPGRSGGPGPGHAVRPRAQRLGARRRVDPDPPPRPARALASASRASR